VKIRHNGHQNLTPPRIIGHEIAGEIVEVGAEVNASYGTQWQVGDRVQVIAAVPCGDCYECSKGWMEVCQNQTSVGYQYDGGFAEFMIVPRQVLKVDGLNRIPDNVGFDEASAAEPFACAINAQEQLGIEPGDTVVVFGAGPIGCMHIGSPAAPVGPVSRRCQRRAPGHVGHAVTRRFHQRGRRRCRGPRVGATNGP
jgi:L-iditol 2-dehydrogenase